jgi:hypothetical protein
MLWFKMKTDNLEDPFIYDLISHHGANGYMVYFGVVSLICRENGKECTGKADFSQTYLCQKLRLRWPTVERVLAFCQAEGKLTFNKVENKLAFDLPKIKDIRDEYSRKSGHKQEVVRHKKEEKKNTDTEPKKVVCVNGKTVRENFDEDWKNYRRKEGNKEKAFKCYQKNIGSDFNKRAKFHAQVIAQNETYPDGKYLLGAEKFFRNWESLEFAGNPRVADTKLKGLVL